MNTNIILAAILTINSLGLSIASILAAMSGLPESLQAQICLLAMATIATYLIHEYGYGKV